MNIYCKTVLATAVMTLIWSITVRAQQAPQVQGFVHETSEASDYVWPTEA